MDSLKKDEIIGVVKKLYATHGDGYNMFKFYYTHKRDLGLKDIIGFNLYDYKEEK